MHKELHVTAKECYLCVGRDRGGSYTPGAMVLLVFFYGDVQKEAIDMNIGNEEIEICQEVTLASLQEMGLSRKESIRLIMTKNSYVTRFGRKYYGMLSDIQMLIEKEQSAVEKSTV